jgi:hypothetical protein|tara:strand:- start:15382 stop:15486 length:105 start_codon:yes stop_codon:yes gene_type:complete
MKRKEKMIRFWIDWLVKIVLFIAAVTAMKLIFFK